MGGAAFVKGGLGHNPVLVADKEVEGTHVSAAVCHRSPYQCVVAMCGVCWFAAQASIVGLSSWVFSVHYCVWEQAICVSALQDLPACPDGGHLVHVTTPSLAHVGHRKSPFGTLSRGDVRQYVGKPISQALHMHISTGAIPLQQGWKGNLYISHSR